MTAREALQTVYSRLMHLHPDWTPDAREACILTALVEAHEARCAYEIGEISDPRDAFALQWNRDAAFKRVRSLERGEEASRG